MTVCVPPSITAQPQNATITSGSGTRLTLSATGTSLSYQWYQGASGVTTTPVGASASYFDTPALSTSTQYWVRVSNICGSADSAAATVNVIQAPTSLVASMATTTSINVSWPASAGAAPDHYVVERRSNGAGYSAVANVNPPNVTYADRVSPNTTYVYRVRAADASGHTTPPSPEDLATTIDFAPVESRGRIYASHLNEILAAVNAVRAANGWAAVTWTGTTGILSAGVPEVARGARIYGEHIAKLRAKMDEALTALMGWPAGNYTDPVLPGSPRVRVRAIHLTELRSRAQ